jgi:hypothetical protein
VWGGAILTRFSTDCHLRLGGEIDNIGFALNKIASAKAQMRLKAVVRMKASRGVD